MNLRALSIFLLLPIFLLSLSGCATTPRTVGSGPQVAVMLVQVKKEKTPQRIVIELREDAAPQT
ncbi:MAG: hypothetical protein WCI42_05925, partial [Verrucomicrobiota bacterium]